MSEKLYETVSEFHRTARNVPLALYKPTVKTERSKIAILAMHGQDYLSFPPMMELAKHGYIAAGANPYRIAGGQIIIPANGAEPMLLDMQSAVEFLKSYPGVEKVILLGHSNGACICSSYQYIAENGTDRFQQPDRVIPFPKLKRLTPADGLMLVDSNYGIMTVFAMDPAVKNLDSGYERDPELDIFNPENGFDPNGSHYSKEFIQKFQNAQMEYYKFLYATAQQRMEDIKLGRGKFADDDTFVIPGGGQGSTQNMLFVEDISLLSRTSKAWPLLHNGGSITTEVIKTTRVPAVGPSSTRFYGGSFVTTVGHFLAEEFRFTGDFGYDESKMWGADWDVAPSASLANVRGIHVPTFLCGNTGGIEFINAEYCYENSVSADKEIVFLEGATHGFEPVHETEKFPGEYGDPVVTIGAYMTKWLSKSGRFID